MHLSFVREFGIALAVICILWIAGRVVRSARRLNAGVRAFKAEQEKHEGIVDPYAALSRLSTAPKKDPDKRD